MERQVIVRDRQEFQSQDLNNVQSFTRQSFDNIVADAVTAGKKAYAGFAVSRTGQTQITVSAGRYYANGPVYYRAEDTVIDLFNVLPLVTGKKVAVTVHGIDVETDVQPRDFLIDTETGATEPQSVAMERRRRAEISIVAGPEGPDPQAPTTDVLVTVIAYITLTAQGVVSVEHVDGNRLPSVSGNAASLADLSRWRAQMRGRVDTLGTDLANIKGSLEQTLTEADGRSLWDAIAQLQSRVAEVGPFISYGEDDYLDPSTGNPAAAGYSAIHDEGVRFPDAASNRAAPETLSLYNPTDPAVRISGNFLLPKYEDAIRIDATGYTGEISIAESSYATTDIVQLTRSRERIRYGAPFIVSMSSKYWRLGQYDPVSHTLSYKGETFDVVNWQYAGILGRLLNFGTVRLRRKFVDRVDDAYWDRVTTTSQISGQRLAQTVLWSSDAWLTAVGLYFTRVGGAGDVEILITEAQPWGPDLSRVIARTTIARADIAVGDGSAAVGLPNIRETRVPLPPTYLAGGGRYAIVINTSGQHYLATTTDDNGNIGGTLYRTTDGVYFLGDINVDLKIRVYTARHASNKYEVEFNAISLAGGISWVDLTYEAKVPSGTSLDLYGYVNNRWQPLTADDDADLSSLPTVLRLKAVFTGTHDLMPGIGIGPGSQVLYGRTASAVTWVGAERALPSAMTDIKLVNRLDNFDAAQHTCNIEIAAGGATIQASTVEDRILSDGAVQRTATFEATPGISAYTVRISGTANSPLNPFVVSRTEHYAAT